MKEQIELKLNKFLIYPIYIIAILGVIGFFRGCSASKENVRLRKELTTMQAEIDSLNTTVSGVYTKKELDLRLELEGLKSSKRTLYDWNAIVRTAVRPDDRMNEYDEQIKALEKQIK